MGRLIRQAGGGGRLLQNKKLDPARFVRAMGTELGAVLLRLQPSGERRAGQGVPDRLQVLASSEYPLLHSKYFPTPAK